MLIYLQEIEAEPERSKFMVIYETYHGIMFHAAFRVLKHPQDAEDAVHQAFLAIADHIQAISDPVSQRTKAYVLTITENKAIDQLRRDRRHPASSLEECGAVAAPTGEDGDLAWCISQLPERQRKLIWLKYYQGYELREIAQMLGISYDAASRLHREAKARLRKLYEKEDAQ